MLLFQEGEIAELERQVVLLKENGVAAVDGEVTPELDKLRTENSKLKYQINHLKRVS